MENISYFSFLINTTLKPHLTNCFTDNRKDRHCATQRNEKNYCPRQRSRLTAEIKDLLCKYFSFFFIKISNAVSSDECMIMT